MISTTITFGKSCPLPLTLQLYRVQVKYSEITYDTTFEDYTMLTGNIVSLAMGGIICGVWSLIAPETYDFVSMKNIEMLDVAEDGDLGFQKVTTCMPHGSHGTCVPVNGVEST